MMGPVNTCPTCQWDWWQPQLLLLQQLLLEVLVT
jgi:hypothetical protein